MIENFNDGIWTDENGIVGVALEIEPIDPERDEVAQVFESLRQALQKVDPRVVVRFWTESWASEHGSHGSRNIATKALGSSASRYVVILETGHELSFKKLFSRVPDLTENRERIAQAVQVIKSSGLQTRLQNREQSLQHFAMHPRDWQVIGSNVDSGHTHLSVVRLDMGRAEEISGLTLYELQKMLPRPFSIRVSALRVSDHEAEITLTRRLKQSSSSKSRLDDARTNALENTILKTSLEGNSLFRVEFLVVMAEHSSEKLKRNIEECARIVSRLGQTRVETYGALPSIYASFAGCPQHVTFQETLTNLPFFLPITGARDLRASPSDSALAFHRTDESIGYLDLFDPTALNANLTIVGRSGRGKSALVGALTTALLHDPKVSVLKVDVGGSHSKECTLFAGVERKISLNAPSGLNPFDGIPDSPDESHRAVLLNFVSSLVLEEGESALTKELRAEIDDLLTKYVKGAGRKSLTGFHQFAKGFSRSKVLSRWVEGGIFGNAFAMDSKIEESVNRLLYLNLSEIFQAGDQEFSQGVMAAVLAIFNLQMMKAHSEFRRLVLICDETPFFIQKCFPFFKFSVANVRKFGASVCLVVQNSTDLVQNADRGIIDNSFHRVLLSQDGDGEDFSKRFGLSLHHMETIHGLQTVPGKYSEFFYQFGDHGIKGQLRLTAEEYWRITTTQKDRQKLDKLMQAVPGLRLEEAIKCLSVQPSL